MINDEVNRLMEYLEEISHKSIKGQIPWNQSNPSTFQWHQESLDNKYIITIQKAIKPKSRTTSRGIELARFDDDESYKHKETYLFQVTDKKQSKLSFQFHLVNVQSSSML